MECVGAVGETADMIRLENHFADSTPHISRLPHAHLRQRDDFFPTNDMTSKAEATMTVR